MEQFLVTLLQNSVVGAAFIVLILLFRQMTKDVTKLYVRILWILLLVELFIPPLISSPFGSMRSALGMTEESWAYERMAQTREKTGNTGTGDPGVGETYTDELYQGEISYTAGSNLSEKELYGNQQETQKQQSFWLAYRGRIVFLVWLSGVIAMALYGLEELLKLRRRVRFAVRAEDGVWETDGVETPFVMPGIPARVYLPCGLNGSGREDILAHERQHIRYLDPWIKLAAAAALMIHWFNPLVWVAYILMGKDLEMFCDEGVLYGKSLEDRKRYSQTLLDFKAKKQRYSLTMQFGENSTGARVRHILYVKKPQLLVSLMLVFAVCCCGLFFLTKTEARERVQYGSFPADMSENRYVQAVQKAGDYSGSIVSYTYAKDYDGDGSTDAFVAIGNVEETQFEGDIWFVDGGGQTQLLEEYVFMEPGQEYLSFGNREYFLLSYNRANSMQTDVYTVEDGAPVNELPYTGAKSLDEDGNLICMIDAYDADYMVPENLFTGHTVKGYTFVLKDGSFSEVSAQEVTEETVSGKADFSVIQERLLEDGFAAYERQYILRENGELNVNLALAEDEEIRFCYYTWRLNAEQGMWEFAEQGDGYYLLSVDQDDWSWLDALRATLGVDAIEPEENETENKTEQTGIAVNAAVGGERSSVVGTAFVPDSALHADDVFDWDRIWEVTEGQTILIERTEHFRLYGTDGINTILVEAPDGSFVRAETPYTSSYGIKPAVNEADYDGDGEPELAVITAVAHGTGIFVNYLFMVDEDAAGQWAMYQLTEDQYLAETKPHFDTVYESEGVRLVFDGKEAGVADQIEKERLEHNYRYYAGPQIRFAFVEDEIRFEAQLVGCSEDEIVLLGDYPGHEIEANVQYLGTSNWQLTDYRYRDFGIDNRVEQAIQSYYGGRVYDVNEYDTVDGFSLDKIDTVYREEEIVIREISYSADDPENGEVEAVAELRLGKEDSLSYLTVKLQRVKEDYGGIEWKIAEWLLEK